MIGIGHLPLSEVRDFLAWPNRVLAVPMEGPTKHDITVCGDGYGLQMAPGALRLAAMAEAVVIPCLIKIRPCLRSTIYFGDPLPHHVVSRRDRHPSACEHILRELGPWIAAQPEQSAPSLVRALRFEGILGR
jgi:hypothetical protein